MSETFSRRDFLKLTGLGAAVSAVLTGCGPTTRYIVRRPYTDLPEFQQIGTSTYYATTCRECPAGCGIIVRTFEGRAIKAEGNPNHPVSRGKICSRGLTSVQGLYNPDRIKGPQHASPRGSGAFQPVDWNAAVTVVSDALRNGAAILLGEGSDHLYDLALEVTEASGAPAPLRYGAQGMFEARRTLVEAARLTYGTAAFPYFDIGSADVVLSFGADFVSSWLSPISYTRQYARFRKGNFGRRGYLIAFDALQSMTSSVADEWYPVTPGSEGLVAMAVARLALEARSQELPAALSGLDLNMVIQTAGISADALRKVAAAVARSQRLVALPGGGALSGVQGLANAQAILALNGLLGSGGVSLQNQAAQPSSMNDILGLIERMNSGQVRALLIHGANPVFELPAAAGFEQALQNVPLVISFASFPDETAALSDYVFPDHTGLEAFGYQRVLPGSDRSMVSALQPVVVPLYDTRATADVLLAAGKAAGANLPYTDEVDFIQQKLVPLREENGSFTAPEILTFWSQFLQNGGWWLNEADLQPAAAEGLLDQSLQMPQNPGSADELFFVTYETLFGDGSGANRPWLQETPDPLTTVMWNSYILINPEKAAELGVHNDDIVRVISSAGEVEAVVYEYPAIRPDTVAMPFGQGHTALGRWAQGRGSNPARVLVPQLNEAGDLAYGTTRVRIEATGQRRPLSRLESKAGVYGGH